MSDSARIPIQNQRFGQAAPFHFFPEPSQKEDLWEKVAELLDFSSCPTW